MYAPMRTEIVSCVQGYSMATGSKETNEMRFNLRVDLEAYSSS